MSNFDIKHNDSEGFEIKFDVGPLSDFENGSFIVRFKGSYVDQSKTEKGAFKKMASLKKRMWG